MASRVNTKFVVWMGVAIVVVVGTVAWIGVRMVNVGGEQNIARAEEYAKAGELKKAITEYGKAVNKDRYRVEWIKAWLASIQKFTPPTRQQYQDMYIREYTGALHALFEADRKNIAPFRQYLDERYQYIDRIGSSLALWEGLAKEHEDLIRKFEGSPRDKDILGRYRGLARAGMFEKNPELDAERRDGGLQDLEAALAADPKDSTALLGAASIERGLSSLAAKSGRKAEADALMAKSRARMEKFTQENPDAVRVRLVQIIDVMKQTQLRAVERRERIADADILTAIKPQADALIATIKSLPPERIDASDALMLARWMPGLSEDGQAAAGELLGQLKKSHAADPIFLIGWATLEQDWASKERSQDLSLARLERSNALAGEVVAIPDRPIGLDGFMLFDYRAIALKKQADTTFVLWERERAIMDKEADAAKKEACAAKVKAFKSTLVGLRTDLAKLKGETAPEVLSIDGRLALVDNNIKGARTLITKYNDQTQRTDVSMLMIEAKLLVNDGQFAAAKSVYERVLQIDEINIVALVDLGNLEAQHLSDYKAAAGHLYSASKLYPDRQIKALFLSYLLWSSENPREDPNVKKAVREDPELQALMLDNPTLPICIEAMKIAQGLTGDLPRAIELLSSSLVKHPHDARLSLQLAKFQFASKDSAGARKTLQDCIAAHPENAEIKQALAVLDTSGLDIDAKVKAVLDSVKESAGNEVSKNLARWNVLRTAGSSEAQQARQATDPKAAQTHQAKAMELYQASVAPLAEAAKLDPDNRQVIEARFTDAQFRKELAEMEKRDALARNDRATVDKCDAAIHQAQVNMDAIVVQAQATNLDKVDGLFFKAQAMMSAGKVEESIGFLRQVIAKDSKNQSAFRLLGLALLETGKPAQAVDALRDAVKLRDNDFIAVIAFIDANRAVGQLAEALEFARRYEDRGEIAGNPIFVARLLDLEAAAPGGIKSKAIEGRRTLAKRELKNRENRVALAFLLLNSATPDEADPDIDELIKEDPDDFTAVQLRATRVSQKPDAAGRQLDVPGAVKIIDDFMAKLPPEKLTEDAFIRASRFMVQLKQPEKARQILDAGRKTQKSKDMVIDREIGDVMFEFASQAPDPASAEARLKDCILAYQRVLDGGSEDPQHIVSKRILESLLKTKRFEDMAKLIAKLPPVAQGDPTILLLQAEAFALQNDRAKALRAYDQAVAANPKNPIGFIKRGEYKLQQARAAQDEQLFKDAEADFEQAVRVDPSSVIGRIEMALLYRQTGRDELAVNMFKEAAGLAPGRDSIRAGLINTLEDLGRFSEAAQACEEAAKQFPSDGGWRIKASQIWGRAGNWAKSVEAIGYVWEHTDGKSPDIAAAYVEALINKGDLLSAFNILNSKDIDASKSLLLRMLRARVLVKRNQPVQAADEVRAALALCQPDSILDASVFAAGLVGVYPKPADQVAALDTLESGKPLDGFLGLKAAEIRIRQDGSRPAAVKRLETLASDSPNERIKAAACSLLGSLAFHSKDWEQAGQWFTRGLKLDPDNAELCNNLAYILSNKLDRGTEAMPYALKAVQAYPQNSGFHDTLGACQLAVKDYPTAVRTLTNALRLAANDAERIPVLIHLAQARVRQGEKTEARGLVSRARDLVITNPASRDLYEADLRELDKAIDGK
jgi:tetratricopeptide (TPR) repeat protein